MQPLLKTRFAPSPTGEMHIGNCRTALLNWLFAQSQKGVFLLRIEDTDLKRSKKIYVDGIIEDLKWLGLHWHEGEGAGGVHGPYCQSERMQLYQRYYDHLLASGQAYPCFCSEEELMRKRRFQLAAGKPPRYSGECYTLTKIQIEQKLNAGIKPTLRFRIPAGATSFIDLLRGEQVFNHDVIGDFIIRRADGTPPFMFCSSIDDALMGVTHILRGEDHLTNTPRQIMVLKALNLPVPQYGHMNLIVGSDGSPLSKRHGGWSIAQCRDQGYLPAALLNYLARLGHHYSNDDLMLISQLTEQFDLKNLSKSPTHFDHQQLDYWQKAAVHHLSDTQAWDWLGHTVKSAIPKNKQDLFLQAVLPNIFFPTDAARWVKILFTSQLLEYEKNPLALWSADQRQAVLVAVKESIYANQDVLLQLKTQFHLKGKALFYPMRLLLTGKTDGPELKHILSLMPQSIQLHRVTAVME
jgi:glutamyl-tRNA synthetase